MICKNQDKMMLLNAQKDGLGEAKHMIIPSMKMI